MKPKVCLSYRNAGLLCAALASFAASLTARADVIQLTLTEESSKVLTASPGWSVTYLSDDHWQVIPITAEAVAYLQSFPPLPIVPPEPKDEPGKVNLVTHMGPLLDVRSDVPSISLLPGTALTPAEPATFQFTFIDQGDVATNVPENGATAAWLALGMLPLLALGSRKDSALTP